MPKRKRTREVTVKDVRTILRLSCAEGLSVREIADRLRIGKSSVSTYWTHPGKVEAPYTVCIAFASNLTGLVKSSVECRRIGL